MIYISVSELASNVSVSELAKQKATLRCSHTTYQKTIRNPLDMYNFQCSAHKLISSYQITSRWTKSTHNFSFHVGQLPSVCLMRLKNSNLGIFVSSVVVYWLTNSNSLFQESASLLHQTAAFILSHVSNGAFRNYKLESVVPFQRTV